MRATKITLKDFLCYGAAEWEPEKAVSILVGANESGKSAILDAIRTNIRGTCRGVPVQDAKELSKDASGKFAVEILWGSTRGGETFTVRRTTSQATGADKQQLTQNDIYEGLGVDPQVLDALLDARRLMRMKAHERLTLAFQLASVRLRDEELERLGLKEKALREAVLQSGWRQAEKMAKEGRLKLKGRLEAIEERSAPPNPTVTLGGESVLASEVDDETYDTITAGITNLEAKRDALNRKIGSSVRPESYDERERALMNQISDLRSALDEAMAAAPRIERVESKLVDIADWERVSREGVEEWTEKRNRLRGEIHELDRSIEALRRADEEHDCPICGNTHTGAAAAGRLEDLRRMRSAKDSALQNAYDQLTGASEELKKARAASSEKEEELHDLTQNLIDQGQGELELVELEGKLKVLQEKEAAEVPDEEIQRLEARLEKVRVLLEDARRIKNLVDSYRDAVRGTEEAKKKVPPIKKKIKALREQELLCRPDGIRKKVAERVLGPIRERARKFAPMMGLDQLEIDDEFNVMAQGRRYGLLSESTKWRVSLVLSDAFAQLAPHLRFLCVDEAAILDGENRAALQKFTVLAGRDYDQMIICMTEGAKPAGQFPDKYDVRVYRTKCGAITAV